MLKLGEQLDDQSMTRRSELSTAGKSADSETGTVELETTEISNASDRESAP